MCHKSRVTCHTNINGPTPSSFITYDPNTTVYIPSSDYGLTGVAYKHQWHLAKLQIILYINRISIEITERKARFKLLVDGNSPYLGISPRNINTAVLKARAKARKSELHCLAKPHKDIVVSLISGCHQAYKLGRAAPLFRDPPCPNSTPSQNLSITNRPLTGLWLFYESCNFK